MHNLFWWTHLFSEGRQSWQTQPVLFLWMWYLGNTGRKFHSTCLKCSLGNKHSYQNLVVKDLGDIMRIFVGIFATSWFMWINFTQISNWIKWLAGVILYPKGESSASLWHANVLQNQTFWLLFNTIIQE